MTIALVALFALAALPGSMARAAQGGAKLSIAGAAGSRSTGTTPAGAPAGAGTPPATPVAVSLVALPQVPRVGQPVRLSVVDPPAGATRYVWDLIGHGAYQHRGEPGWHTDAVFDSAGTHSVAVRFTAGGTVHAGVLRLTVAAAHASGPRAPGAAYSSAGHAAHHSAAPRTRSRRAAPRVARTAGDPGVTIADFHFSPSATTVHVGDTITWTNDGPSAHSATASDGSFDTGVLQKGQSGSHTFTKAGTFAYVCTIHPFMHGTIVVLASTSPSTTTQPAPSAAAPATQTTTGSPASAAGPAAGQPTLPNTGMNVLGGLLAGLLLLGSGAALRRTLAK
jgi:plastocyanin